MKVKIRGIQEYLTMTLTQLNYIITIAETNSINKAAEQLYVSQPSLTSAVRELEKELGIILFYRSGRGVTLRKRLPQEKIRRLHTALFLCCESVRGYGKTV